MALYHHEDSIKELNETKSNHELTQESAEAMVALAELGELLADAAEKVEEAMLAIAELGEMVAE